MTTTRTSVTAESLVYMYDEAHALPAIYSGVLDAKISELKSLKDELAIAMVNEANKIKADAASQAASLLAQAKLEANSVTMTAKKAAEEGDAKLAAITRQGQTLFAAGEKLKTDRGDLDAASAQLASAKAALEARALALDGQAVDLAKREAKLKADTTALNARLESLKLQI